MLWHQQPSYDCIVLFHSHHDHVTDDAVGVAQVGISVLVLLLH